MIATAGYDQEIKLWDLKNTQVLQVLRVEGHVNRLAFSPDNKFLASAGYGNVRLYDHHAPNPQSTGVSSFSEHKLNVTAIGFHQDAKWMFSASEDSTVKIWDMRDKKSQRQYQGASPVNAAVLLPNQNEVMLADQAGYVHWWDCTASRVARQCRLGNGIAAVPVRAVAASPDGSKCFAADNEGRIAIWDMSNPEVSTEIPAHHSYVLQLAVSNDSRLLATMSADRTVRVWLIETMELVTELVGHNRWVWDGVFSADCKSLLTVSSDLSWRLWDIEQAEPLQTSIGHTKAVVAVAMND